MSFTTAVNPKKNKWDRRKRPTVVEQNTVGDKTFSLRSDGSVTTRVPYVNKRLIRNKYRAI